MSARSCARLPSPVLWRRPETPCYTSPWHYIAIGWRAVKPAVVANTGNRIESVWTEDGPRYGSDVSPDDLDVSEQDPEDHRLTDIEFDGRHDFGDRHDRDGGRD